MPIKLFINEKEYLKPVNYEILENYSLIEKTYKVSHESMISYHGIKYSVPIQYIGKPITVKDTDNVIYLYYNKKLICSYRKNEKYKYNYKEEDYIDILKHSIFTEKTESELEEYIDKNLNSLDRIFIDKASGKDFNRNEYKVLKRILILLFSYIYETILQLIYLYLEYNIYTYKHKEKSNL